MMYITSPRAAELRKFIYKSGPKEHIFLLCRTLTYSGKKHDVNVSLFILQTLQTFDGAS